MASRAPTSEKGCLGNIVNSMLQCHICGHFQYTCCFKNSAALPHAPHEQDSSSKNSRTSIFSNTPGNVLILPSLQCQARNSLNISAIVASTSWFSRSNIPREQSLSPSSHLLRQAFQVTTRGKKVHTHTHIYII